MREKLIKLLDEFSAPVMLLDTKLMDWNIPTKDLKEALADYLVANGVTIQQWVPVTDRLPHFSPNRWRKVLVTIEDKAGKRFTSTAKYDEELKQWYLFSNIRFAEDKNFKVVAWMPKPEPMKEGK